MYFVFVKRRLGKLIDAKAVGPELQFLSRTLLATRFEHLTSRPEVLDIIRLREKRKRDKNLLVLK